jgi:hypothetical protein
MAVKLYAGVLHAGALHAGALHADVEIPECEPANPEPALFGTIEIAHFVPKEAVDPTWRRSAFVLEPDGPDPDYFALERALTVTDRVGIARWGTAREPQFGMLTSGEAGLALIAWHPSAELASVVPGLSLPTASGWPAPPAGPVGHFLAGAGNVFTVSRPNSPS